MFKILVPVDFTEEAEKASLTALQFASENNHVHLLLLHCFQDYLADTEPDAISPFPSLASEEITDRVIYRNELEAQEHLEEFYTKVASKAQHATGQVYVERTFINGLPEEEIVKEANRFKPDLVIMGTKGESDVARAIFGTITTKVVKELRVPVLTIPTHFKGISFNKVVYATDFHTHDVKAIEQLQYLLKPFNPNIHCLHISDDASKTKEANKLKTLQASLEQNNTGQNLCYMLLEGNDVTDALQHYVEGNQIDLVAVTTQKRSFLDKLFHSSVTKDLVLHAAVPLLVFHEPA